MIKKGEIEINNQDELNKELNKIIQDPSINKPSEKEIEEAKIKFEDEVKVFTLKMWKIGNVENVNEVYDYIVHFMNNRYIWAKDAWMGLIKLKEEIDAAKNICTNEKGLEIGYQALEFIFYMLSNPGGKGLADALDFESENEIYVKVLTFVGESLEEARKMLKNIEFLQQRWGSMAQGFYLELEEENLPIEEDKINNENIEELSEEELYNGADVTEK